MAYTSLERNLIIGLVSIVVLAAVGGVLFLTLGGEDEPVATTATTPTQTVPTQTQTQTETVVTVVVPAETPPPAAESAPQLEIVSRSAVPDTVSTNGPIEFIAEVRGQATSVTMSIRGPQDSTVDLVKGITTPGGITIWRANATAPGVPGIYRYFAAAAASDGSTVEMPGVSGWSFQVVP